MRASLCCVLLLTVFAVLPSARASSTDDAVDLTEVNATPAPTPSPGPTPPPTPEPGMTQTKKFGISTATFTIASVVWLTICFALNKAASRGKEDGGPVAKPYQPVQAPGAKI